jgi:mRNA interferase MazF
VFEPGELVMVPFPFSDLSSAKRRPVLALTAPDSLGDFIACPITSRGRRSHARRLLPDDLVQGALPLASWVRTDKVVTLHVGLVVKRFGRASEAIRAAVASEVCRFIGARETASPG